MSVLVNSDAAAAAAANDDSSASDSPPPPPPPPHSPRAQTQLSCADDSTAAVENGIRRLEMTSSGSSSDDDDASVTDDSDSDSASDSDIRKKIEPGGSGDGSGAIADLHGGAMKRRISAPAFDEGDLFSSSDDEDFKSMSVSSLGRSSSRDVAVSRRYSVVKSNRYGIRMKRVLVVDIAHRAFRFLSIKDVTKSEFPLSQIAKLERSALDKDKAWDTRRLCMHFVGRSRMYQLKFRTLDDISDFCDTVNPLLDHPIRMIDARGVATPFKESTSATIIARELGAQGSRNSLSLSLSTSRSDTGLNAESSRSVNYRASVGAVGSVPFDRREQSQSIVRCSKLQAVLGNVDADNASYLEYHVLKKNKYGIKQARIVVLNSHRRSLLLLNTERKARKEIMLSDILQVEISDIKAVIMFSSEQRPFHLFFSDAFDLLHFCERLSVLNSLIRIKDREGVDDDGMMRFTVHKVNKVGRRKKRILYLDAAKKVIRSVNLAKNIKDTPIGNGKLLSIEKPYDDKLSVTLTFMHRSPWHFVFSSPLARERFVHQARLIASIRDYVPSEHASVGDGIDPATVCASPHESDISMFVGTWNVGGAAFDSLNSLSDFIPPMKHDMYVIALQECSKRDSWVSGLTRHVQGNDNRQPEHRVTPPSVQRYGSSDSDATKDRDSQHHDSDTDSDGEEEEEGTYPRHRHSLPSTRISVFGAGAALRSSKGAFVPVFVKNLWEIMLVVLVRREHVHRITNIQGQTIACGVGDVLGNKGAVAMSFRYLETSFCIISAHLEARAERKVQRRENYKKIVQQLHMGRRSYDILAQFDHIFFVGDLNYRVELSFNETVRLVEEKEWDRIVAAEQLSSEMMQGTAFHGFNEGSIDFAPTYRFEKHTSAFSNKRNQPPSYTDRVLWRSLPGLDDLKLLSYRGHPDVFGSDHRPLSSVFMFRSHMMGSVGLRQPSNTFVITRLRFIPSRLSEQRPTLVCRLNSSIFEDAVKTEGTDYSSDLGCWSWASVLEVTPFLSNSDIVDRAHLMVSICSNSGCHDRASVHCVGTVSLKGLSNSKRRTKFSVDALQDGSPIGLLEGDLHYHIGVCSLSSGSK